MTRIAAAESAHEVAFDEPYGLLMEPGPTLVDPRVTAAAGQPPIHHLHPHFQQVVGRVVDGLSAVTGTSCSTLIPATGRGGVEAAMTSLTLEGRRILVLRNGEFGDMLHAIARRQPAQVQSYERASGETFDREAVARIAAAWRPHVVMMVHSESSTGMLNDIAAVAGIAAEVDALLLVDAISSAGAMELDADGVGIDLTVTASQKALGALTGLSSVSWSRRALDALHTRPRDPDQYYLDLRRWWDSWLTEAEGGRARPGARRLPWSMPTALVLALEAALDAIDRETLAARAGRHAAMAARFRLLARDLGYSTLVDDDVASPSLTALLPPDGIAANGVLRALEADGIRVAGGIGELAGRILRVGHMAESARPLPLARTAVALGNAIGSRIDLPTAMKWMEDGR